MLFVWIFERKLDLIAKAVCFVLFIREWLCVQHRLWVVTFIMDPLTIYHWSTSLSLVSVILNREAAGASTVLLNAHLVTIADLLHFVCGNGCSDKID
jgi:hypothetical protein